MNLTCKICGWEGHFLAYHLTSVHHMTGEEYQTLHPGPVISDRLRSSMGTVDIPRVPITETCQIDLAGVRFPVNLDVPEEACLPLPKHYVLPLNGTMGRVVSHMMVGLKTKRSVWLYGPTGSGKDAIFHFFSNITRTPAVFIEMRPGEDISGLICSRGFQNGNTVWEEGRVLKALRDGYVTKKGDRVPYMVLISDIDRATPEQIEMLRPILDSIEGRICRPDGEVDRVLPGSMVVATANTAGDGTRSVMYVTAQAQDVSILNRFDLFFYLGYPDWSVWAKAIQSAYKDLLEENPSLIDVLGQFVRALHQGGGKSMNPFSFRDVRSCLDHIRDLMKHQPNKWDVKDPQIVFAGLRSWFSRLTPDATAAALTLANVHMKVGSKSVTVPKSLEDFP